MDNVKEPKLDNTPSSNTSLEIPESNFSLTLKQQRFIEAYKKLGDANKAAISAGYAVKSVAVEANRLLKNPKILESIKSIRSARQAMITKDDFVELALADYKQLELTEPNKPRFLDLAGKALGYTGNNIDARSVTNNTQVNISISGQEKQPELWDIARKLLGT